MEDKKFSFRKRILSFKYAIEGLRIFFCHEHNAWIHIVATVFVVLLGLFYGITSTEWLFVSMAIGLVFVTEAVNTAIEYLCNLVSREYHPEIKVVKDVAAGAVLLSALVAVVIGVVIFLPRLFEF